MQLAPRNRSGNAPVGKGNSCRRYGRCSCGGGGWRNENKNGRKGGRKGQSTRESGEVERDAVEPRQEALHPAASEMDVLPMTAEEHLHGRNPVPDKEPGIPTAPPSPLHS